MNELLREIEEDIRRERFDKLWHSFGKLMVGVSIMVILFTIAMVIIQNHKQSRAMEQTTQFIKGMDRLNIEDYKGAITIFAALADNTSSSYYGLAMLHKAQAENALADHAGAAKTYQELARQDPVLGGLAAMLTPPDSTLPEPVKNSPFYYTQSEWKGWQLMQQGKKKEAVAQFFALYEDNIAPSSMHQRLSEVLHYIAPEKLASAKAALDKEITHE